MFGSHQSLRRAVVGGAAAGALLVGAAWTRSVDSLDGEEREPAVYHPDPRHLWNRLHEALFVRVTDDGREYGRDRLEPLLWRGTKHLLGGASHDRLLALLGEFIRDDGETLLQDARARAMLQRDLWLVFSWLESNHDDFAGLGGAPVAWRASQERLRRPLAAAISRLALGPAQIAKLPDNYAAAAGSAEFANRHRPDQPGKPYLPPDLFEADGPWVCLGREGGLVAPMHVLGDNPFTNSVFLTFLRLPGGRSATIGYVERLRGFKGPLLVKGLEGGGPFGYLPNPRLPGFPVDTQVALVRRALLVTSQGEVAATPLTEGVQLRVYREVPPMTAGALQEGLSGDGAVLRRLGALQSSYEFVLSRPLLLAGRSGGLRAIAPDERDFRTGFATHGVDFFEEDRGMARSEGSRERVLESCAHCHGFPGVYSFNTFFPYRMGSLRNADVTRPGKLSVMSVPAVLAAAVRWKQDRPEWGVLQRLLREDKIP